MYNHQRIKAKVVLFFFKNNSLSKEKVVAFSSNFVKQYV